MSGTGRVLGACTSTVATCGVTAAVLPNTGSNGLITVAIAVASGLVTWGALYAFANRKTA